ncbi:MAG: T9SS type A sorting domain-containing protein, partial [Bacteroidetes bacterium]|nr:T9SS type A sorting domain-containing protein [Bacteroidota bacterium]
FSGSQDAGNKSSTVNVTCVRSFSSTDNLCLTVSTTTGTNQPVMVALTTQPQTQTKCPGSSVSFTVAASGTAPYSYQWKKNGADIVNDTSNTFTINNLSLADEGVYTCEVSNLCRNVISDDATLNVIDISANAGTDERICNGNNTTLTAIGGTNHVTESGTLSYVWSPATGLSETNTAVTTANPVVSTNYTVQVTDVLGCTETDAVTVTVGNVFQDEEICLVTVDTSTWKNKIMWEKTVDAGTEYYLIYKETGTNSYTQIGNVPYSLLSEYIDYFSVPESHGDKYKITALDTCGNESELSYYHKTINLTIAAFGSTMGLNWDDYEDESGNYSPFRYYIYRGTDPTNMSLLDSVSGSFNSYNDVSVFDVYYYIVAVKKPNGCNVSKSGDFLAFSNKKDNSTLIGLVEYNGFNNEALSIFPNPFKESTTVKFYNPDNKSYQLTLTDASGRMVRKVETVSGTEFTIDRKDLSAGVYLMEITGESRIFRGKIVVE